MMATQGADNGPAWDNSVHVKLLSVLLLHMVLLALPNKCMPLSFHAFRGEKHLREDAVGIGGVPVHRGLLLLKCLICRRLLGSLTYAPAKGKGM